MTHEEEVQRECERLGIKNDPIPEVCSKCGGELLKSNGFAGETVLCCKACNTIEWEDHVDAIRKVL